MKRTILAPAVIALALGTCATAVFAADLMPGMEATGAETPSKQAAEVLAMNEAAPPVTPAVPATPAQPAVPPADGANPPATPAVPAEPATPASPSGSHGGDHGHH